MFKPDSPFLNLPENLNRKQAFYLDGIRHAFEIIECAFSRLSAGLSELGKNYSEKNRPSSYVAYYLDAWAFVDALDRLVALWKLQPSAHTIPDPWNPDKLKEKMRNIRDIRNVSDHLAQRADQIISKNSTALGELSWITVIKLEPPEMKSCFIRPGILSPKIHFQMNIPKQSMFVANGAGNILLKAHTYTANLSEAYQHVIELAEYAEASLKSSFRNQDPGRLLGGDLFAICDLDSSVENN
ncbi:hypothetical protein [Desulfuromonas acetoxidans]|uniref:hypothetical protein n=1 Tax=Desulfuromonas acetoxidans TaxID=891 RepID=UPI00292F9754|nr:hypothetical protein [Desulfuromonas acetoxidans]